MRTVLVPFCAAGREYWFQNWSTGWALRKKEFQKAWKSEENIVLVPSAEPCAHSRLSLQLCQQRKRTSGSSTGFDSGSLQTRNCPISAPKEVFLKNRSCLIIYREYFLEPSLLQLSPILPWAHERSPRISPVILRRSDLFAVVKSVLTGGQKDKTGFFR